MNFNGVEPGGSQAAAAMASMQAHGVEPTPSHFSVWYAYHSGENSDLTRTIDVLLSNHCPIDDQALDQLHGTFFRPPVSEKALCEKSIRARDTLKTVLDLVEKAKGDAGGHEYLGTIPCQRAQSRRVDQLPGRRDQPNRGPQRAARSRPQAVESDKIGALERTLEDLRREATTDGLTGIANRRYFDMTLQSMSGDAMNSGDELSLLLIDIDHFKKVNDTWGHAAGDAVIQFVATALAQTVRGQDCVARYGGEEFAVILPTTSVDAAMRVGENIRTALSRRTIIAPNSEATIPAVTVSVGVACYDPGKSLAQLVQRADAALYQAKKTGRNRVVAA